MHVSPTQGTHVALRKEGTDLARDKGAGLSSSAGQCQQLRKQRGLPPHAYLRWCHIASPEGTSHARVSQFEDRESM